MICCIEKHTQFLHPPYWGYPSSDKECPMRVGFQLSVQKSEGAPISELTSTIPVSFPLISLAEDPRARSHAAIGVYADTKHKPKWLPRSGK
jgi:hypothetical protein